MRRLFLSRMLCGLMLAAAFTFVFAIRANNYRSQMEIWNRGGAAWTLIKMAITVGSGWLTQFRILPLKAIHHAAIYGKSS